MWTCCCSTRPAPSRSAIAARRRFIPRPVSMPANWQTLRNLPRSPMKRPKAVRSSCWPSRSFSSVGVTWPQARNDSIRKLVEETYRIQEFPSTILLGPDAKVLVLNQDDLRGDRLLETLDRLLPR